LSSREGGEIDPWGLEVVVEIELAAILNESGPAFGAESSGSSGIRAGVFGES
jgi:hypothetical protein